MSITEHDHALLAAAADAADCAYVPYSGFRVGAALRTKSGAVIVGCNVENASYGLTICAERTALVRAVAEGHRDVETIAIWVDGPEGQPCGACRQFMVEFGLATRVLFRSGGEIVVRTVGQLVPDAFIPAALAD